MGMTEFHEYDQGHCRGVVRDANEKKGRQGFVICDPQFMAFASVKDMAIVFSGIPLALTALYRWLHSDTESRQQILEG
jgi:hypothetical protein